MGRLTDRVAIVTGGGGGIGSATCRRFVEEGARVAVADVDRDAAQAVADELGDAAVAVFVDAERPDSVLSMVDAVAAQLGRLDILHNNAALSSVMPSDTSVIDVDLEIWDRTMAVNLRGYLVGARAAIPHMIAAGGGSIVNTASEGGLFGGMERTAYGASKGGVITLTKYIATQYGRQGVRCNAIAPGLIATAALVRNEPTLLEPMRRHVVLPRHGAPEDVANLACFLASDESSFITGQTITIDGGLGMKLSFAADQLG